MKPTKHTSFVPMTPDARPKQRLNEVVGLPAKPDDMDVFVEWVNPIASERHPKGTPRKLTFVCSVEWAWSPTNNRIANYYINPKPWGWVLWDNWNCLSMAGNLLHSFECKLHSRCSQHDLACPCVVEHLRIRNCRQALDCGLLTPKLVHPCEGVRVLFLELLPQSHIMDISVAAMQLSKACNGVFIFKSAKLKS